MRPVSHYRGIGLGSCQLGQLGQRPELLPAMVKGEGGGVPWVQIMENEFEYLADRGGHGGHLGEKFVKKDCS